ncbi:MAG: group III truncated hemoglobin [Aquihabitans sp.]
MDDRDMGGDPACWSGLVTDHRDEPVEPDPAAKLDLTTPTDVHDLVIHFYREIVFDELLEPVFGEVAEVDWAEHIPKLIDYWCWILFGAKRYAGAVTKVHRHLHGLQPIEAEHCDRWYLLWVASIDARWAGPNAEHADRHAATLMAGLAKHVFGFSWVAPTR